VDIPVLLRNAVKITDTIVKSAEVTVTVKLWDNTYDDFGNPHLVTSTRQALVDLKQRTVRAKDGTLTQSQAYVAFLQPIVIDRYTEIILPDGRTWPIITYASLVDPGTNQGYYAEVYLG
jgi:hypothetical protein